MARIWTEVAQLMLSMPIKKKSKEEKEGGSPFLYVLTLNEVITLPRPRPTRWSHKSLWRAANHNSLGHIPSSVTLFQHPLWHFLGDFHFFLNTVVVYIFICLNTIRRSWVVMMGTELPNLSLWILPGHSAEFVYSTTEFLTQ